MDYIKRVEAELILEWQKLQRERIPYLKEEALKAYYVKLRQYRQQQEHNLLLFGL